MVVEISRRTSIGLRLKDSYLKVLKVMSDGEPRTGDEICYACGLERLPCTGAISILRRTKALDDIGHGRYRITPVGKQMTIEARREGAKA
ncbi:MAG TPA: hypothetical protein VGR53_06945 [Nitrososphaerales archaeon]|nr:hypothetical protein [Nitrososphaerales archaeon]